MKTGRILVVDDQEEILETLGAILLDEGHDVIKARDGQEALHIMQSDSPDIVFLDIWIPGIDGMQTLKAIRRINPECAVIMMSGHGTIETAVKAIKLGATDYLEKPLNLEDVLHLVHSAIEKKSRAKKPSLSAYSTFDLIGTSAASEKMRNSIANAASETKSVLLSGEKGTGKEFLAGLIHYRSGGLKTGLAKVRCSELTSDNLAAFMAGRSAQKVDSVRDRLQGSGSALVLIRIDRLSPDLQLPLLDAVRKVKAGNKPGFRLITTSSVDSEILVSQMNFPEELVSLLGERIIRVPALRERIEDIPLYIDYFLKEASEEFEQEIEAIDDEAVSRLQAYAWPGNIKELKILIEHTAMTAAGPVITANDLLIPMKEIGGDDSKNSKSDVTQLPSAGVFTSSVGAACVPEALRYQKTLRGRAVMYGQGLHSGAKTGLTLSPLPPNTGILFGHITSGGSVSATLGNVESTEFSTCLKSNGLLAKTIEHLMAVFHVYGLTNILAKISGEVPIMDGSAVQFCELVESAEIIVQEEPAHEIRIAETFELDFPKDSSKMLRVEPSECLEIEYFLDYPFPIGKLHFSYKSVDAESFKREIAPARTFGFVRDMRMMDEMGLAGGGRLSNVILVDEEKVVNPPLRFPDEFVRHKVLDIIGDFYLLGRPFVGKIVARQTGHSDNVRMLKIIKDRMEL
jgi:UDP-3-O-acyl N-acetylglucosamine deacetylase